MKKLIFFLLLPIFISNLNAQNNTEESNEDAVYRQFDFWLGDWDVYKTGTKDILGYSKIESIVDGFAIKETKTLF